MVARCRGLAPRARDPPQCRLETIGVRFTQRRGFLDFRHTVDVGSNGWILRFSTALPCGRRLLYADRRAFRASTARGRPESRGPDVRRWPNRRRSKTVSAAPAIAVGRANTARIFIRTLWKFWRLASQIVVGAFGIGARRLVLKRACDVDEPGARSGGAALAEALLEIWHRNFPQNVSFRASCMMRGSLAI